MQNVRKLKTRPMCVLLRTLSVIAVARSETERERAERAERAQREQRTGRTGRTGRIERAERGQREGTEGRIPVHAWLNGNERAALTKNSDASHVPDSMMAARKRPDDWRCAAVDESENRRE